MRFDSSFLDEIRRCLPISTVIGERVLWDRRKTKASRGDWWACCPFHAEKSPSFHCEDSRGRYHCFGCGASGDHFLFLIKLDGLSFPEAVEKIAAIAGIPLPAVSQDERVKAKSSADIYSVMELATVFFEQQLQSSVGAKARAYLDGRHLKSFVQQAFRIGYASSHRTALKEFLALKGVSPASMEASGLFVFEGVSVSYDRFRDRIIFPIEDLRGRVIAFGGRALSEGASAKYINSPETLIFHKKEILYNLARARKAVQKNRQIIVVEGYIDVISLVQSGISDAVVAPLGTAITPQQLEALWRISPEPIFCFDGDSAGLKAASRVVDLVLTMTDSSRSAYFSLLPEGQDPDDLIRFGQADVLKKILSEPFPLFDMLWTRETRGVLLDTPERCAILEKNLEKSVSGIKDRVLQFHYTREIRKRLRDFFSLSSQGHGRLSKKYEQGSRNTLSGFYPSSRPSFVVSTNLKTSPLVKNAQVHAFPLREAVIVVTLINNPVLAEEFFDEVERIKFLHPSLKLLFSVLVDAMARRVADDPDKISEAICMAGLQSVWESACLQVKRSQHWSSFRDSVAEDARKAFLQVLDLYNLGKTSKEELYAFKEAFVNEPTEENYRSLIDVRNRFQDMQEKDLLIENSGVTLPKNVND